MKKNNPTLLKIAVLLNDQQFHDGTSIGEKLNITRAAVWKAIRKIAKLSNINNVNKR